MRILYALFLKLYYSVVFISSFFNHKSKKWIEGRKLTKLLQAGDFTHLHPKRILFHCASVGEFEQARNLIERIKTEQKDVSIILTFFSPSGYEIRKNYAYADMVMYLPFDFKNDVISFLKLVKPSHVIIVKYEFWFNFIEAVYSFSIPLYLISANFRREQLFFRPIVGNYFLRYLSCFTQIFVQEKRAKEILNAFAIDNVEIAGDTRIDRVLTTRKLNKENQIVQDFVGDSFTIVAGSTWHKDEAILAEAMQNFPNFKFVIAPHEVDTNSIKRVQHIFKNSVLYSTYQRINKENQVLIIDNIGMLSTLYKYANIAYIGGGFGAGIHNVLEPAVYNIPVVFGVKYYKFNEAVQLLEQGLAKSISNASELKEAFIYFKNIDKEKFKIASNKYFEEQAGATDIIYRKLFNKN